MPRRIEVQIVGDSSSLHKALGDVTLRSRRFGSVLGSTVRAGSIAATAGIVALGYALKRGIDDFSESQKVAAQTRAVLKSTGGAAGVTAKHVNSLSQSLSNMSGVDDEAIGSSENLLLTFRNIRNEAGKNNDIFDQATKATLDMSVAMGTDLHSASILVGKALNDPVKGMTALRRVGVSLSDSQTKLVTHLVDTGHAAEAQKIILGELRKEFGGSAKAAGDTMAGQMNKLKNAFDNAASAVIQELLPYVVRLAQFAFPLAVSAIQTVSGAIRGAIHWLGRIASRFQILGSSSESGGQRVRNAFEQVRSFFQQNVFPIVRRLQAVFSDAMTKIGQVVQQHGEQIHRIANRVGNALKAIAQVALPILRVALVTVLPKVIGVAIDALDKLTHAIQVVVGWFKRVGQSDAWNREISHIQTTISWVNSLISTIQSLISWINRIPAVNTSGLGLLGIDPTKGLLNQVAGIGGGGASGGGGGGGRGTAQININVDGKTIHSVVVRQDQLFKRQNAGRSAFA